MEAPWRARHRDLSRAVARWRRPLAALAAGLAALSAISGLRPDPPPTDTITVAARDLASGTRLRASDVSTVELPHEAVPDGAYGPGKAPLGRLVAAPVRRGQPLTDTSLVGSGLAQGLPDDQVLTSIEVAAATGWLVRPGDVVDVVAGTPRGSFGADIVATGATVVAAPRAAASADGRALILALDGSAALAVTQAALVSPLALLVRSP